MFNSVTLRFLITLSPFASKVDVVKPQ